MLRPVLINTLHCHFFAVCDGHGINGKQVSSFLKKQLPKAIKHSLAKIDTSFLTNKNYKNENSNTTEIIDCMVSAFFETNDELHKQPFDVRFSGSTCISVFLIGERIF